MAAECAHLCRRSGIRSRREMACLVKFAVVGQILLGYHAQQLSLTADGGAVVQCAVGCVGKSHDDQYGQVSRFVQNANQFFLCAPEQGLLEKQVAAGVPGQTKFRESGKLCAGLCRLFGFCDDLVGVVCAVCHTQRRCDAGNFQKSIFHGVCLLIGYSTFIIPQCWKNCKWETAVVFQNKKQHDKSLSCCFFSDGNEFAAGIAHHALVGYHIPAVGTAVDREHAAVGDCADDRSLGRRKLP